MLTSISLLQSSWLSGIAAGTVLNVSLPWKRFFPTILQDALHYGKLKLDATGTGRRGFGQLNVPKSTEGTLGKGTAVWFTHFYAWGVLWNAAILYYFTSVCMSENLSHIPYMESGLTFLTSLHIEEECRTAVPTQRHFDTLVVLLLICLQVSRRLYECLFVSVFSGSVMHLLHYVLGFYFYTALGPTALLHTSSRPSAPETKLEISSSSSAPVLWSLLHWYHIVGFCLFAWASLHQHRCHRILANLRDHGVRRNFSDHLYFLPRGDWFEYVSSPHYFAELLIYASLLIIFVATDWRTNLWLVEVFTASTLLLSARQVHLWYRQKFKDYPKDRKIIIPGIY